ncbi:MAG: transpeptidase family protein [Bacteroidaceae bacterium]|nr:transpeptidase family protein [Bacteroidaceae bacterium]
MFQFRENIVYRYYILVLFGFTLFALVIIGNAAIVMFKERDEWNKIKERNIKYNVPIEPHRGNILNDNGELMVSTLPLYRIHLDFVYINKHSQKDENETRRKRDSLWTKEIDALCIGLNEIFPQKSVESFKKDLAYGHKNKKRYHPLYNRKISYTQYLRILELPIINKGKKYSGIIVEEEIQRKNIFGDIGMSTFGIVRKTTDNNKKEIEEINGLEKKYDQALRGIPGVGRKEKIGGKFILKTDKAAENGMDLQTTINSEMLDICENAVKKVLTKYHLPAGWAVLMETGTGDIKAIVNLTKLGNGVYAETIENIPNNPTPNHALCRLMEPGSIFKTVALTAAIEDGKLTTKDSVIAYKSKVCHFGKQKVTDEMYRDNGTGKYSMAEALKYSSNISMVQYIRKAYGKNPQEYTNTLLRFGLTDNYKLIDNEATPYLTLPETKRWNGFSLNSMSYGYAVGMTGINILSFYNTIANGGKQMQPRLVKAIIKDGEVIEEFPTKILDKQLISKATTDTITSLLVEVVNGKDGTGARAKSKLMTVAGKTGTANIPNSQTGVYDNSEKMMSFCGFFPAEQPKYTLLVQMIYDKKQDTRPDSLRIKLGGGSSAAIAFKEIAEKIMAQQNAASIDAVCDTINNRLPNVKYGNMQEAHRILEELEHPMYKHSWLNEERESMIWGKTMLENDSIYKFQGKTISSEFVPDVRGMGAKDAVYLMQQCNLDVEISGYGTVKSQSIVAGTKITGKRKVKLTLAP